MCVCECGFGWGVGGRWGEGGGEWWWWFRVLFTTVKACACHSAYLHQIQVTEHLGVRLLVSPPPGPQRPDGRRAKNVAFLQQIRQPHGHAGSQR